MKRKRSSRRVTPTGWLVFLDQMAFQGCRETQVLLAGMALKERKTAPESEAPKGVAGILGKLGLRGPEGPRWQMGEKGVNGTGSPGNIGPRGYKGFKGERGPEGTKGLMGKKGVNGTGTPGNIGPRGSKGIKGQKGDAGNIDPRQLANWKQCAWKLATNEDSGKIKHNLPISK